MRVANYTIRARQGQLLGPFQAILEICDFLVRYRQLTWELVKRDLTDRYAGQWLGALWVIVHPLLLIGVYIFVFAYVLDIRFGESDTLPGHYVSYILAGLIPWLSFQEAMTKSCAAVTGQSALVKQIVFPVEILPLKTMFASCMTLLILLVGLMGYRLTQPEGIPMTSLFVPILVFGQMIAMAGVGFFLSAIAVYIRDTKDIIQVLGMIIYLMPVFYLPNWVPAGWQALFYANPFSYMIWCYQDALYFGRIEHPWAWIVFLGISYGMLYLGYLCFKTLKPRFGNAL